MIQMNSVKEELCGLSNHGTFFRCTSKVQKKVVFAICKVEPALLLLNSQLLYLKGSYFIVVWRTDKTALSLYMLYCI